MELDHEAKTADHQISKDEVHDVLDDPIIDEAPSQSTPHIASSKAKPGMAAGSSWSTKK